MKTSDLKAGRIYATAKRHLDWSRPSLLLDTRLWRERDMQTADQTKERLVRLAPEGSRPGLFTGWGRDYSNVGLPVLVLHVSDHAFDDRAGEDQIMETPRSILLRARDTMNVMGLVAEGSDGRVTQTTLRQITLRVLTVKGVARKVLMELEFLRPQQISALWTEYVEGARKEALSKIEMERRFADRKAESDAAAADIARRIDTLLGWTARDSGLRRKESSRAVNSVHEIQDDLLRALLLLAEKGAGR